MDPSSSEFRTRQIDIHTALRKPMSNPQVRIYTHAEHSLPFSGNDPRRLEGTEELEHASAQRNLMTPRECLEASETETPHNSRLSFLLCG